MGPAAAAVATMSTWDRFVFSFFNLDIARQYLPAIAKGFVTTVYLAIAVIIAGVLLGLLLALLRSFRNKLVNFCIIMFADIMRALPPLVLIILIFFALPYAGLSLEAFAATWVALSLVLAAFAEEIFWAGIVAVPRGQWEAARSTGLSKLQTLGYVVLSQAVRMTIPPLTNRVIAITKGTALGSVVALSEILNQASSSASQAGNATPLTVGALAYLILFIPVVMFGRWVETRFAWKK